MVDYDYDDPVPVNATQMAQSYGLVSSDVWQPFTVVAEAARMNQDMKQRYITSNTRVEIEPRTAYCGYLFLATNGCTVACTFDLFVEYDVELFTPQAASDPGYLPLVTRLVPFATAPVKYPVGIAASSSAGRVVVAGTSGVPSMVKDSVSWNGLGVLDLRDCLSGMVELTYAISANAATPKTTAPGASIEGAYFDQLGNFLGWFSQWCSPGTPLAATYSYSWDTVGATLASLAYANLAGVRSAVPSLAFLALAITNAFAKTGETANTLNGSVRLLRRLL
jgi:hypothetical protein